MSTKPNAERRPPLDLSRYEVVAVRPTPWRQESSGGTIRDANGRPIAYLTDIDGDCSSDAPLSPVDHISGDLMADSPSLLAEVRQLRADVSKLREALGEVVESRYLPGPEPHYLWQTDRDIRTIAKAVLAETEATP